MSKFKLMAGKHIGDDGKVYRPGSVVESEEDLSKKWVNKFERAIPAEGQIRRSKNKGQPEEMVPEGQEDDDKFQETENSDKDTTDRAFVGPKDKVKAAEAKVAAAEAELEEAVKHAAAAKKAAKDAKDDDEEDEEPDEEAASEDEEAEESAKSKLGEDVSEDFPDAGKNDLVVLKKGRNFHVAEKEDINKAVHKKALKNSDVNDFIAKYVKG